MTISVTMAQSTMCPQKSTNLNVLINEVIHQFRFSGNTILSFGMLNSECVNCVNVGYMLTDHGVVLIT